MNVALSAIVRGPPHVRRVDLLIPVVVLHEDGGPLERRAWDEDGADPVVARSPGISIGRPASRVSIRLTRTSPRFSPAEASVRRGSGRLSIQKRRRSSHPAVQAQLGQADIAIRTPRRCRREDLRHGRSRPRRHMRPRTCCDPDGPSTPPTVHGLHVHVTSDSR